MMSPKLSFTVLFILLCNMVSVTRSSTSFRSLFEPTSFTDVLQFISNKPYTIRGKTLNYEANVSKIFEKIHDVTPSPGTRETATSRRWHVGRVSRKQYEIVNMLWRRTNVFIDEDNTTPVVHLQSKTEQKNQMDNICEACRRAKLSNILTTHRPILQSTTPSYIEFYYLVEMENETVPNDISLLSASNRKNNYVTTQNRKIANSVFTMQRLPLFSFHNYVSTLETPTLTMVQNHKNTLKNIPISLAENFKNYAGFGKRSTLVAEKQAVNVTNKCEEQTCGYRTDTTKPDSVHEHHSDIMTYSVAEVSSDQTSTLSDKIKFFEVYDSNTQESPSRYEDVNSDIGNDINIEQKIELEHIDQELGHQSSKKNKMIKKHVYETATTTNFKEIKETTVKISMKAVATTKPSENFTNESVNHHYHQFTNNSRFSNAPPRSKIFFNTSRAAFWAQYPFAAVYVYERFQVHCDAAVISRHWLLASASCLSRHHDDPVGDSRTAFVTYCGESWWDPERINYVKYSLINPKFSSTDRVRRHLYNIGLIQVVTSMASACNNWAPVSLISHQYVAEQEGSMASAIGWGLDRYDTRYSSSDLPRRPLSVYDGLVFSDSCPGNIGYRRAKHHNEEGIKNVYCLSLPPYSGEDDDPVHGGLLLVGGKLIALYLQEERRQWGDQSAQYTGIWRLVPWIMDVVKEPDDGDFLL